MNFKGHFFSGVFVGGVVAYSSKDPFLSFSLILAGSLFPDVDTHSVFSRWIAFVGVCISLYSIYQKQFFLSSLIGLFFMICKTGKHRGWTHKYSLVLFLLGLSFYFHLTFLIYFCMGLLVHYLVDGISPFSIKSYI